MIKLRNLHKSYGKQVIFDQVNFDFPDRGLICILGASGCGKSTLLHLLAGFDCEYEGTIEVFDQSITTMDSTALCAYRKYTIGFMFQDYNLLQGYSVLENILMATVLHPEEAIPHKEKAMQLLAKLNLSEKANEKVEHLSGGQKQRVAMIRSLMNGPSILLADEPTGSLDRENANDIMCLLKEIANDCLVILITHDKKICSYADHILHIENKQIVGECPSSLPSNRVEKRKQNSLVSTNKLAWKNFKVHWRRYVPVSFGIAFGMLAFLLSLSFGNIMESSINDFKEKNIAFNNGYIKADKNIDSTYTLLKEDKRIEHFYYQYIIQDISLRIDKKIVSMNEKYPMAKAAEKMSYGSMPKLGQKEISLSPSLAKKFDTNIVNLVGKQLQFNYQDSEITLTISGIFNAGYDDFFLSSDLEQTLYKDKDSTQAYALSYDVKTFEDVVSVSLMLKDKGIHSITIADEVGALQETFQNLMHLFTIVSVLILLSSIFIGTVLLVKLQNTRYREIGLLSALGFDQRTMKAMINKENIILAILAACFNLSLLCITYLLCIQFDIHISILQYALSICGSMIIILLIGKIASRKLISTEPAIALKK